jgi:hypothetical protein
LPLKTLLLYSISGKMYVLFLLLKNPILSTKPIWAGMVLFLFFSFFRYKKLVTFFQKISRISQILTRKNSNFFGWKTDKILSLKKITVYEVSTSF